MTTVPISGIASTSCCRRCSSTPYVVRALFKTFAPDFEPRAALTDFWLTAGLLRWAQQVGQEDNREAIGAVFEDILRELPLDCPHCVVRLDFGMENTRLFWDQGEVRCSKCDISLPWFEPSHVVHDGQEPSDQAEAE